MVDQRLHRLAHDVLDVLQAVAESVWAQGQLRRPGDLLVLDHHRAGFQPVQRLPDEPDGLAHLLDPDDEAGPAVTVVMGRHLEVVVLIAEVGLGLAQVPRQAGRAQQRAGNTEGETALDVEVPDALEPALPDRLAGEQLAHAPDLTLLLVGPGADLVHGAVGQVLRDPPGPDEGMVHPQPGDELQDVHALLPRPESVRHPGQGAELHPAGREPDPVRGNPVDLHEQQPDGLRALWCLHTEQFLHTEAVRRLVEDRRQVVHPGDERGALRPVPVLGVLLDPGVQVADDHPRLGDRLALQVEDEPKYAVRGRVLWTHVDDEAFLGGEVAGERRLPVAAGDRVDPAFGGLPRTCGVRIRFGRHW